MKKSIFILFIFLLVALILANCSRNKKSLKEDAFLGEWYTVKGGVEAYSFMKDNKNYILSGTHGGRPVIFGTWKINKDKFVITMDNGTVTTYSFSLTNDTLVFNGGEEIYTKTLPLEVRFPEVRILKDITSAYSSHRFTEPMPVNFSWGIWVDSTHSSKELQLKGYGIAMASSILSDDLENLAGFLSDHGFSKDTAIVSEICKGFWDDNQLVTICTGQSAETMGDSLGVIISSAFIK